MSMHSLTWRFVTSGTEKWMDLAFTTQTNHSCFLLINTLWIYYWLWIWLTCLHVVLLIYNYQMDQHSHFFFGLCYFAPFAPSKEMLFWGTGLAGWASLFVLVFGAGYSFVFLVPAMTQAIYLKNYLILLPVFAETSIYVSPNSVILEFARFC